jgi:peroxiredoxin
MIELGELEKHQAEFAARKIQIVAISVDDLETSRETQAAFPHLIVVSDAGAKLTAQFGLLQPGAGPGGADIAAPTHLVIDQRGIVCWIFRAERIITRQSPFDLLAGFDRCSM